MAEVAAGVIAVEQVVSTGLEVGAAATVARPTQPLTAVLSQIATTPKEDNSYAPPSATVNDANGNSLSLARSHHSVSVIDGKAYIFGGKKDDGKLCNNDIHAVSIGDHQGEGEYACYPAVGDEGQIPSPRINHASCTRRDTLIIHGGQNSDDEPVDDEFTLWEWEPKAARWSSITAAGKAPQYRYGHQIFYDAKKDNLVLHGGYENGQRTKTTWLFDFTTRLWHPLPDAPAEPLAAQFVEGTLYSVSAESDVHGSVHYIKPGSIQDESLEVLPDWTTVDFPSNPLVPGPRPRVGSALIAVTTGHGRRYLIYLLGSRQDASISSDRTYTEEHPFYSDMWTLQLPSDGYSATRVKDAIRETIPGVQSGAFSWHELEIAPAEMTQEAGKVHPGPRGFFGADGCLDGKGVLMWGGVNAKGETEADGWLLKIS
ncbi:Rho GTPase-activating gacHH [Fusarium acutatum]|uniref:Rho GTPase-activating gacHH n=1 Tax=Fusarium acutatum TaxID=78861 RepID=A0A8H4JCS9_9HYPO|nr:Rho GTPase-activating gacHH [Fusarium acutatum]